MPPWTFERMVVGDVEGGFLSEPNGATPPFCVRMSLRETGFSYLKPPPATGPGSRQLELPPGGRRCEPRCTIAQLAIPKKESGGLVEPG